MSTNDIIPRTNSQASRYGLVRIILITGIIVFLIRFFLFKPFFVQGQSMEPNFEENQYLIIDLFSHHFYEPERGQSVVIKFEDRYLLKRIIALPGERIKISEGQIMIYNDTHPEGVLLDESYLPKDVLTTGERITALSTNEYFVLGDNRSRSKDSRHFGVVTQEQLVGRVLLRGWPLSKAVIFTTPQFNF